MKKKYQDFLNLIVYQVYPRSFYDSNGDGIGDLKGITQKLDHIKELGANAVWLSPCYKSPNEDNGYDISDYRDIMDEFGALSDWEEMVGEMKKRGLRLIMDLVVNHTSAEHVWFREGRKSRDNPYHDYYYWAEKPLNDWQSCFGGSAWEYNPATKEYYLHSFAVGQPDLNWENPKVRKEMRDIVDYWVDKGVDGFRCDVLDFISKDFRKGLPCNGPRLHEYIKELFGREKTKDIFTVGECQAGMAEMEALCGEDRGELCCTFQFDHFGVGRRGRFEKTPYSIDEIRDILARWQNFTQEKGLLYTLFTDNHDQQRFITRLGNDGELRYECATAYATVFFLLRGIPFLYQGQEFGAVGSQHASIEDFDDVETLHYYKTVEGSMSRERLMERVNFGSRDNARRPMSWSGGKGQGFTTGTPWLPFYTRGEEINLERDRAAEKSVFAYYKALLRLRNEEECIRQGEFVDRTPQSGCFVYERRLGEEQILVVCNFDKAQDVDLTRILQGEYVALLHNYENADLSARRSYAPFETLVLKKRVAGTR